MTREQVEKAQMKHRHLMHLIKKVGRRTNGMCFKLTKFHCTMHMADDMLNFRVPMEVDTGSNESAHKSEKRAAKLTQKRRETFDIQTSKMLEEMHLIDLGMEEIKGNCLWNHGKHLPCTMQNAPNDRNVGLGGQKFHTRFCATFGRNIGASFGLFPPVRGSFEAILAIFPTGSTFPAVAASRQCGLFCENVPFFS